LTASTTHLPLQRFVFPGSAVGTKFTDTIEIDQEAHVLYAGDNWTGGMDVFDIATPEPKFVRTIKMRNTFYGISVAKNVNKVFVGLRSSAVAVIDGDPGSPKFHTVIAEIDTGGRGSADLIDYDPTDKKLYAANRNDGFMTAIDAVSNTVVKRIEGLGGGLEQPRYNPTDGMVYLCGNSDDVLYQVDAKTDTLMNTFPIGDVCRPNGLAINPKSNMALLACNNRERPHTVIGT